MSWPLSKLTKVYFMVDRGLVATKANDTQVTAWFHKVRGSIDTCNYPFVSYDANRSYFTINIHKTHSNWMIRVADIDKTDTTSSTVCEGDQASIFCDIQDFRNNFVVCVARAFQHCADGEGCDTVEIVLAGTHPGTRKR